MSAAVASRRRRRGLRSDRVRADANALLNELRVQAELSIALVSDVEMQHLNSTYRRVDRPTDVLAFPMSESTDESPQPHLLGDVVISIDTAARQAAQRDVGLAEEVRVLLTHGILHLLGYDHERSPSEARRMFRRQRELLARLATTRPL